MERREFLKIAFGFAAAAGAVATTVATAQAAPLLPQGMPPDGPAKPDQLAAQDEAAKAEPAIATQDDIDSIGPEQVQWRRRYWRRPYWRRRYWRRRY
jgi:predicted alpha/beta-hydrolase family hydrolase